MNSVEEIINKHVNEFQNDFESGYVSFKFSLIFNDGLIDYDVEIMRVDLHCIVICYDFISFLKRLNENINFLNISHLTITIETGLKQMTIILIENEKANDRVAFVKEEHSSLYINFHPFLYR